MASASANISGPLYLIGIISIALFSLQTTLFAAEKIEYSVEMSKPDTHYFQVNVNLSDLQHDFIDMKMPVWAPGSYLVREFAGNVENFRAYNKDGQLLDVEKTDKNTWRINKRNIRQVQVRYDVYAYELSVRTSYLDSEHAFISGSSVFMFADGYKHVPVTLKVVPFDGWTTISTGLEKKEDEDNTYAIPNYDVLVDAPIEIGNHKVLEFEASGVLHEIALFGTGNYDEYKLTRDFTKIAEAATDIFGENPNKSYTFIIHNLDRGSGGLEHFNSCSIQVNRWIYGSDKSYKSFLGLVAHEYFHLWWVKRLKPKNLYEIDYSQENYTNLLWAMEGFSNYYEIVILKRAGFIDDREFLDYITDMFQSLQNRPGRNTQSVAMASFDAWIKYYRQNENSINAQVSYYNKGAVLGVLIDLEVIRSSKMRYTLDDVLKFLYKEYYKRQQAGITEMDLKMAIERFAGVSMDALFEHYVHGTDEIDYEKYMFYAGIKLIETNGEMNYLSLGVEFKDQSDDLIIALVKRGTSGYRGGIYAGDEILAVDDFRVKSPALLDFIINNKNIGDTVHLLIARDGLMKQLNIVLDRETEVQYTYELSENPSREQNRIYRYWLNRKL